MGQMATASCLHSLLAMCLILMHVRKLKNGLTKPRAQAQQQQQQQRYPAKVLEVSGSSVGVTWGHREFRCENEVMLGLKFTTHWNVGK